MVSNTQKVKRIKKEGAEKIYEDDNHIYIETHSRVNKEHFRLVFV